MSSSPKHQATQPIGVFDSGIGGLTVANAIQQRLPQEQLVYFGDTAHLPYGDKSADAIRYYSLRIAKFLLEQNCKMIVIACNSASTAAYKVLLDFFRQEALFVNVVDPLVDRVVSEGFQKVGLIATKATVHSGVYEQLFRQKQPGLELRSLATPLLTPMIEEGYLQNRISSALIDNYLQDPQLEGIEALLLACTHYPLIRPEIDAFYRHQVKIFDSTDVVADLVYKKLESADLLNRSPAAPHKFYVSDYTDAFEETTRLFYPGEIQLEHCPLW